MYEVNGLPTVLALHSQLKSIQLRVPIDYYIRSLDSAYYCMKNLVTGPLTQTTMPTTIQTMEFYLEASSTGPVEDGVTYIATSLRSNNRIHRDSVFLTSSTAWGAFSPKNLHAAHPQLQRLVVNLQIVEYDKANVRGHQVPAIISQLEEDIRDSILNGDNIDGDIVAQPDTICACSVVVNVTM